MDPDRCRMQIPEKLASRPARRYSAPMSSTSFPARGDKKQVEEGLTFSPKFDADGLIPAVALDAATREPLMLAYMNAESLQLTLEKGEAVYWSRSRQEIWHKGATSGHVQKVREIRTDCDQDAIVLFVEQLGAGACHTGRSGCFYRKIEGPDGSMSLTEEDRAFDPDSVYGKA